MTPSVLRIHDWEHWQSYRKGRGQPNWIKVYRSLLRDLKWIQLTDAERGQLVSIWLLAADHHGCIPSSPELLMKLLMTSEKPHLERFLELGFLDATAPPTGDQLAANWLPPDGEMTPQKRREEKRREENSRQPTGDHVVTTMSPQPAFNAGPKPADDGFDREHGFAELHALYPKREDGHAAQVAYCESLIGRSLIAGCGAREAHCWLMQRVAVYVKLTPIAFMHGMTQFLVKGIYKQDDAAWQRGSNSDSAPKVLSTPRVSAADRRRKQLLDDPNTAPEVKAKLRQQAVAAGDRP